MVSVLLSLFSVLPLFTLLTAHGAPSPLTSTSQLVWSQRGLYKSELGFQLDTRDSNWELFDAEDRQSGVLLSFRHKRKEFAFGTLTVRTDQKIRRKKFKKYLKKWSTLYYKLGFEIINEKMFPYKNHQGYLIDVFHRKLKKQARQYIFFNGKTAVMLNCSSSPENFKLIVPDCAKVVKSLTWNLSK